MIRFSRLLCPLLFLCLLMPVGCRPERTLSPSCRLALDNLDKVLEREEEMTLIKQTRLTFLRDQLAKSSNPYGQYRVYDELFAEFYRYDIDSALVYAYRKEALARTLGDGPLLEDAVMDLAMRSQISGGYYNALNLMGSLGPEQEISQEHRSRYYQVYQSIYHGLVLTIHDSVLQEGFREQELHFQRLIQGFLKEGMMSFYTVNASILIQEGASAKARELLEKPYRENVLPIDEMSILLYWIAKTYNAEGDKDQALEYFLRSARYDFLGSSNASRSLVQAARLLLEKGQTDRAYTYITRVYEDAIQADARICLDEVADLMPDIISAYSKLKKRRIRQLTVSVFLLILLLTVSIGVLLNIHSLHQKLARANRRIQAINASLQQNVLQLKEANDIKESYLGRYMSMFSTHINSLERYRSSLRGVAKSMNLHEILQALKSDDFIDAERESLYTEFDRTFLGVFPNFVEQLNAMLEEDKRIGQGLPKGKLSNELRIFALIRLGVTESAQIAQFLKKSPSTIYNYRVKLRNASIYAHDDFEVRLMNIGK